MTDVMVHMGSFLAVVVYFWRDILKLIGGAFDLRARAHDLWGKLALFIVAATIPPSSSVLILDQIGFMDAVRGMPRTRRLERHHLRHPALCVRPLWSVGSSAWRT